MTVTRNGREQEIMLEMEKMASSTQSDFAAIALPSEHFGKMKWDIVIGSRNGRIKQMKIKPGIGLGGMVLRHGKSYLVNQNQQLSMRKECPVMLAEKLESGIALPLYTSEAVVCGILLLGRREGMYTEEDVQSVQTLIEELLNYRTSGRYDGTTIR
jgi:nitrogen regulatory protein A